MATNFPKFDQYMKDHAHQMKMESPIPRYGLISSFDPTTNTATVILSAPDSDGIQQILRSVPCPVYPGLQTAAPGPGQPCFVVFLSSRNESRPLVISYFNHEFNKREYRRHYDARDGVSQFYLNM